MEQKNQQPRTREELYERIRASSKESFILEDMIRLGFWPAKGEIPTGDPADEIRRREEVVKQLNDLRAKNRHLNNEQEVLKKLKKERLEESKKKQKENKLKREQLRKEKAEAWKEKKSKEIVYLGQGVSGGLNKIFTDSERLAKYNLPVLENAQQVAEKMNISLGLLRFISFSRKVTPVSHYIRFSVPKKSGGYRVISAPRQNLKNAQYWILDNILNKIDIHQSAHGFITGKSIKSNAELHIGTNAVINIDLKDFFPSISYKRIKGLFKSLGYSEQVATIFGLITTEPEVEEVELDNKKWFVALTDRYLPQGAPTSPALTNLLCRRLDRRLEGLAKNLDFKYTRYADDLTFSANNSEALSQIGKLLRSVKSIVEHEGFNINDKKTHVARKSRQQEVTGIVINKKMNIDKATLKKFRATLYQIEKDGPEGKNWNNSKDLMSSIVGYANFINMVNPEKGKVFKEQVKRITDKYGWKPTIITYKKKDVIQEVTEVKTNEVLKELPKKKKWWQIFK